MSTAAQPRWMDTVRPPNGAARYVSKFFQKGRRHSTSPRTRMTSPSVTRMSANPVEVTIGTSMSKPVVTTAGS